VTIIPRGRSLGVTEQLPEEDRYSFPESYLMAKLVVSMGGRAAEELVFADVTSGAQNDLRVATEMARRMVARWGMSKRLGPVAYVSDDDSYLHRELPSTRTFSEHTAMLIDEEVKRIIEECYERALRLLAGNRDKLDLLAAALLEREVLGKEEIERLAGFEPDRPAPEQPYRPEGPPEEPRPALPH
jgi:cell division protease FtsH